MIYIATTTINKPTKALKLFAKIVLPKYPSGRNDPNSGLPSL